MFNIYNEAILSQPPFLLQLPSKKRESSRYKRFCLYGLTNLLLTFINNYEVLSYEKRESKEWQLRIDCSEKPIR